MRVHHGMLAVYVSSKRVDDVIDRQTQLDLTVILCTGFEQLTMPLNKYLARSVDQNFTDLRILKKFLHGAIICCIIENLIQEWLFSFPKITIRILICFENQFLQQFFIALAQRWSFIHKFNKIFQNSGT